MEKVFYNILSNAFKYTPENKSITILVEKSDNWVTVSIIDTGIGISKNDLKHIFEYFFQADTENSNISTIGTGIGLALCKSIVDSHKGIITASSKLDEGSVFKVELLLGDTHFDEDQKIEFTQKRESLFYDNIIPEQDFIEEIKESQRVITSKIPAILIVEDNDELRQVLATIFLPIYTVLTAKNGLEGYEKASQFQPDIILTDVMMPEMSGTELCRKIKKNFNTSHIPVVLLTAHTAIEHTIEGLIIGADDYISKPFNTKILIIRCNNLVNGRKLLQSHFSKSTVIEPELVASTNKDKELLNKAIEIVIKNMANEDFDVDSFAREMGLGRTNLFAKIKGITGQTPNDFILNIRIKKSLDLLLSDKEMKIDEIASRVGFNEATYFYKKFKKLFGKTPALYRKEHYCQHQ
jgi:DNA-binding response OmpR family regulator